MILVYVNETLLLTSYRVIDRTELFTRSTENLFLIASVIMIGQYNYWAPEQFFFFFCIHVETIITINRLRSCCTQRYLIITFTSCKIYVQFQIKESTHYVPCEFLIYIFECNIKTTQNISSIKRLFILYILIMIY